MTDQSGLTPGIAQQLEFFVLAVHSGRFDDAAVHDRLARAQLFEGVAKQLRMAADATMLCATRAIQAPPWTPESEDS